MMAAAVVMAFPLGCGPTWTLFFDMEENCNAEEAIHALEEIVAKLRQVDVLVSASSIADAIRQIGVAQGGLLLGGIKEYGGLKADQVKRLKRHEQGIRRAAPGGLRPDPGQAHLAGGSGETS